MDESERTSLRHTGGVLEGSVISHYIIFMGSEHMLAAWVFDGPLRPLPGQPQDLLVEMP